jgi:mRNA export factor
VSFPAINLAANLQPNQLPTPVVATAFNNNHTILAWAQSYDWSRGHAGNTPDMVTKVGLHVVRDEEVKGKKPDEKR